MAARRVGIKDVAERAGVSWKTVSNVVHGRTNVRPQTRDRVLHAIDELGYVPNQVGRDLRGDPTKVIALVVPDLENPYFARLAQRAQAEARRRGFTVAVQLSLDDAELEWSFIAGRTARPVDAVILSPSALASDRLVEERSGRPLVLLGESLVAAPDVVHVAMDNRGSAVEVVQHLVDQGRRSILFVGAQDSAAPHATWRERLDGYREGLRRVGHGHDPRYEIHVEQWDRPDGRAAVERALDDDVDFDAVIAANDLLAIGVLAGLRDRGRSVPEDVAVVGWDDIPEAAYAAPPLSSVAPDLDRLVAAALDAAIDPPADRIAHEMQIPHRLVLRASSATTPATSQTRIALEGAVRLTEPEDQR